MSETANPEDGVLERMHIPVEVTPPDTIMTSGKASSIRFRVSHPQGYSFGDVESFLFEHLIPTLNWFGDALHQRNLAVHALGELADNLEVQLANTRAQLENAQLNAEIGIMADTSNDDPDLMEEVLTLRSDKQRLEAQLAAGGGGAPGEDTFTREQVQELINNSVLAAIAQYQQENPAPDMSTMYTQEQVQRMLDEATANSVSAAANAGFSQAQVDEAVAAATANVYTHDQVQGFVNDAVAQATAGLHTEEALQAAVAAAGANAAPAEGTYTHDQVQGFVNDAVAQATTGLHTEEALQAAVAAAAANAAPAEGTYTHDQVQGFVNDAVAQATAGLHTEEALQAAVAAASANAAPAEGTYTHDQVQGFVNDAVAQATAGLHTEEALQAAVAAAGASAPPAEGTYTHDQVQGFVNDAVAQATAGLHTEEALQAAVAAAGGRSSEDAFYEELYGSDSVESEAKLVSLQSLYGQEKAYSKSLEEELTKLTGRTFSTTPELPPLNPEDV